MAKKRKCGVLLPVSSLPSKYGIGCFDKKAYEFVDALKEAGQSYWQILPLGPTSYGDSPYQSFSTFAGNPYFISLEELIKEGVLTKKECESVDFGTDATSVDYAKLYEGRMILLRKAYERSNVYMDSEFRRFQEEEAWWLKDYALFMAVKKRFGGIPWSEWAEDIRLRWQNALDYYREEMYFEIEFQEYMQFKFRQQWMKLKAYANEKGIQIIGDIPIYVAMDSADTWANPWLFKLDEKNCPIQVAGCPPDGFSATGQLWGNPLYDWDAMEKDGYAWWVRRIRHMCSIYDVVRIDHFRGFAGYYAIPYGDKTAEHGRWREGPGYALFAAIKKKLGDPHIIAEDLGFLTQDVNDLLRRCGYPGMKVLEFGFDSRDGGEYRPHGYPVNSIAYVGTHDNEPVNGWMETASPEDVARAVQYLNLTKQEGYHWGMMRGVWASASELAIVQAQDILGLGHEARMNTPSTVGNNWCWRAKRGVFNDRLAAKLYQAAELYERLPR